MTNKAFFFDRDGVINYRPVGDYVKSPEEFHFCPDLFQFLKYVKEKNYLAIVITNQKGVSKGIMTEEQLHDVHNYMQSELMKNTNFKFDDIYYSTDPADIIFTRSKPSPEMIFEAIEKYDLDESECWIVGDSITDIMAGESAGIRTVLLGNELTELIDEDGDEVDPDFIVHNLTELTEMFNRIINYEIPFLKSLFGG